MNTESYLNHPNFGLLFKVCSINDNQELFTTLYAQRLFFLVTINNKGISFESVSRTEGRLLVENRLRQLRREGENTEYLELNKIYQRTF